MNNIFIEGEKIDLCVPAEEDFPIWAGWFNSQKNTQFLEQGKFPNTVDEQKEFYFNAIKSNRFIALIKCKDGVLLGVISLSEINYEKSSCQISLVCPIKSKNSPMAALEAMALVVEHAFKRLGMKRVWAGQAYPGLESWNRALEIVGFKVEGFLRNGFVHGWDVTDSILISVVLQDFLRLIERRDGHLWPGEVIANGVLKAIKKHEAMARKVKRLIEGAHLENDSLLTELESKHAR